jgi:hypothetical protein
MANVGGVDIPEASEPKPPQEHILQFFEYGTIPCDLARICAPFADLAHLTAAALPRNPERTVALRKLLEARDAAVRAKLAK